MKKLFTLFLSAIALTVVSVGCGDGTSADEFSADELAAQYEAIARSGDVMEMSLHAELVAQAYLAEGDEANYQKWKKISKDADKKVGAAIDKAVDEAVDEAFAE